MLESLRNNMKLLKSSKRHVLLFELAYKLLALAVFYPVITGVIRLCMRITGINYLTNEYIAKAFMNPVIIIFCLLGVIGFIVYCWHILQYVLKPREKVYRHLLLITYIMPFCGLKSC